MVKKVVLLTAGVAIGVAMMALPASSHVVEGGAGAFAHLVDHMKQYFFTKSRSDERYANAVPDTDKARNADKLDGMDSNFFVRGVGDVAGHRATSGHNGSTVGLAGTNGLGSVSGKCEIGDTGWLLFANGSGVELDAWWSNKDGQHYATVGTTGDESQLQLTTPSNVDDFVVLHVSAGGRTATFTAAQHPLAAGCLFSANFVATGG